MAGKYAAIIAFAGKMAVDDGDPESMKYGPYTTKTVRAFIRAFNDNIDDVADFNYTDTLDNYGKVEGSIENIDIEHADLDIVVAIITYCVREDYFTSGTLTEHSLNGFMDRCLNRLKELDS